MSKASVCAFIQSLTRAELKSINPAELYKLIEFGLCEEGVISPASSALEVREAILLWCAGALTEWDLLENSPWFSDFYSEKPDIRRHVALIRQRIAASRRAEQETITEEELAELFED
jgi:hypothetical protein